MNDFDARARAAADRVRRRAAEIAVDVDLFGAGGHRNIAGRRALAVCVVALVGVVGVGTWAVLDNDATRQLATDRTTVSERTDTEVPSSAIDAEPGPPTSTGASAPITSTVVTPTPIPVIERPMVAASVCAATSTRQFGIEDDTLYLFAISREAPIPIQIIGDRSGGPAAPFALVERFFDPSSMRQAGGTAQVFANGNGEARWDLADGSQGYARSRGFDQATLEAIVQRLSPRAADAAIPGFDFADGLGATTGLMLLHERLNTHVTGHLSAMECHDPQSDGVYRISSLRGDPVLVYAGVIDRPVPLEVGFIDDTVIVIDGTADPAAPTVADVFDADVGSWDDIPVSTSPVEPGDTPPTATGD